MKTVCIWVLLTLASVDVSLSASPAKFPMKDDKECKVSICPEDWLLYNGHCYLIETSTAKNWHDSKNYCNSQKAYLARIEAATENNWIKQQLLAKNALSDTFFIGATDLITEGTYYWESNNEVVTFSDFADTLSSSVSNDCIGIKITNSVFSWNNILCTETGKFICEMDLACMQKEEEDDDEIVY